MQTIRPFIRYGKTMHSRSRPPAWETIEYPALNLRYPTGSYVNLTEQDINYAIQTREGIEALQKVYREHMDLYQTIGTVMKQDHVMSFYCNVIDSSVYMPYGDGTEGNPYRDLEWALSDIRCVMRNTCYKHRAILHLSGNVTELGPHVLDEHNNVGEWKGELYIDGLQKDGSRLSFSGNIVRLSGVHIRNMDINISEMNLRSGFFLPVSLYNVKIHQLKGQPYYTHTFNPIIVYNCELSKINANSGGILFAENTIFSDGDVYFRHYTQYGSLNPENVFLYKDNFDISSEMSYEHTSFVKNCTFHNIRTLKYSNDLGLICVDCTFKGDFNASSCYSLCIRPKFTEIGECEMMYCIFVDSQINSNSTGSINTNYGLWDNVHYTGTKKCSAGTLIGSTMDGPMVGAVGYLMKNSEVKSSSTTRDAYEYGFSFNIIDSSTISTSGVVFGKEQISNSIIECHHAYGGKLSDSKLAMLARYPDYYSDGVLIFREIINSKIDFTILPPADVERANTVYLDLASDYHDEFVLDNVNIHIDIQVPNVWFLEYDSGQNIKAANSTVLLTGRVSASKPDNENFDYDMYISAHGPKSTGLTQTYDIEYTIPDDKSYYLYFTTLESDCNIVGFQRLAYLCTESWHTRSMYTALTEFKGTTRHTSYTDCEGRSESWSDTIC